MIKEAEVGKGGKHYTAVLTVDGSGAESRDLVKLKGGWETGGEEILDGKRVRGIWMRTREEEDKKSQRTVNWKEGNEKIVA